MPDLLELLRLRNVFGTKTPIVMNGPESGGFGGNLRPKTNIFDGMERENPPVQFGRDYTPPNPNAIPQEQDDYSRLSELFKPETEYSDRYQAHLDAMPRRNKPGIGRKIFASLIGLAGDPKLVDNAMYGKYNRDLADWKEEGESLSPGLSAEKASNTNNRILASDIARNKIADKRADTAQQEADRKLKTDEENLKIRRDRAEVYRFRAMNPNAVIRQDKDGMLIAIDPMDGKAKYVIGSDGLPVKGDDMPTEDRLRLQIQGRMDLAEEQAENARSLEGQRNANRLGQIAASGEQARTTKSTPANSDGSIDETTTLISPVDTDGDGKADSRSTTTRRVNTPAPKKGTVRFTANGKTYNIPADKVAAFKKANPTAKEVK